MSEEKNNNGLKIALGVLVALLIGAATLFFLKNNELNETKAELTSEISILKSDLEVEKKQLTDRINENIVLDERLIQKRDSLNMVIEALDASKMTIADLNRYKNDYYNLKKEIQQLLKKNKELQLANEVLTKEKDTLTGQLQTERVLSETLTTKVTEANEVIKSASEITVAALKGIAVIEKSSGKHIPTNKARRADKVKICFSVAENEIAEKGAKTLYVQVLDTKNNVLGENTTVVLDGKTLNYSFKTVFHYTNKSLDICDYLMEPKDGFEKGNYFVNVFRDIKLISNTSFSLR